MTACIKTFHYGNHTVSLETGVVARQATGSVMVNMDGTVVLVTVVGVEAADSGKDFFPLSVFYQERMYAAGKIPGGFFKREGRPSENETLVSRLIDRPLRPLFPKWFKNEVQVVATVMSINPEVNPDIPAMIGASAAMAISGLPFNGPVGAARVGYIDSNFVLNPTYSELEKSDLDLVVAGTESSVLMVESEAKQLPESTMLEAVMFGHSKMQIVLKAINELVKEAGKPKWQLTPPPQNEALVKFVHQFANERVQAAYQIADKGLRQQTLAQIRAEVLQKWTEQATAEVAATDLTQITENLSALESTIVRSNILKGDPRIDGRDTETVRPIQVQTQVLPRTHGSAFFTRGETQAIVVATIGTARDAQVIETPNGEKKEKFLLHYNFPPYCVGETGMVGSPKRREIGHGKLAKRAIVPILPEESDFPYVMRLVSEITESNGSSSMASVCGSSLALMDAGVPLKAPVAGIAMGLIKAEDKFAVLTDILGDEDHLGDMDFKVAGSKNGITALQMDIKIDGITREIMEVALEQAKKGRLHILDIMNANLSGPRTEISEFAPRIYAFKINPEKIRDVIGKGGATIRSLTEESGASIEISDEGLVCIVAKDQIAGEAVKKRIEALTADVEVNKIYNGKVVRVMDFGAFVNILPGRDGLVHISQISDDRIQDINAVIEVGQTVQVKVLEIDRQGRIRLSMKEVEKDTNTAAAKTDTTKAEAEEN